MEETNEYFQSKGEPTASPMPGTEKPPVPPESAPLLDLAEFAACRIRWASAKDQEANQLLRATGPARWEAGWAWSIIKKRMEGGEPFQGCTSFRDWAITKSGQSKETVYRWLRVVSRVTEQEAVGLSARELLVRAGEIDSPEVQQAKSDVEEAAKRKAKFDQKEEEQDEKAASRTMEVSNEEETENVGVATKTKNNNPKTNRNPRPRTTAREENGSDEGEDACESDVNTTTSGTQQPQTLAEDEESPLEKIRRAKALIQSIHFPNDAVRKAAGELAEAIGSLLCSKKPIPKGKWRVRALGWMDPDKNGGAKILADSVVSGTVNSGFSIGRRPVHIIDLEIADGTNGKPPIPSPGARTPPMGNAAEATLPVEFVEEAQMTTWLEILDKAVAETRTLPVTVKLPVTNQQKQVLREQLENDTLTYEPDTLDDL